MKITPEMKSHMFTALLVLVIFMLTYTVLLLIGLVPKQFQNDSVSGEESIFKIVKNQTKQKSEFIPDSNLIPQKIEIPKIGVSSYIEVPSNVQVATLDAALARGAVYYPGSGTLQEGNMFLFGHSTNWKVVNNQAYKTFNNLEDLVIGDEIQIISNDVTYIYKVTTVTRAAEDDVLVEFDKGDRMLTISTCDTFGKKQDRWVVEAEYYQML